jgi:hypothetical protein
METMNNVRLGILAALAGVLSAVSAHIHGDEGGFWTLLAFATWAIVIVDVFMGPKGNSNGQN